MTPAALILVVEDNALNLKLVRDVLDHVGYRTLAATDGEEGVELAGAHQPDLTLMDVQLPGIDGVEALSRLRADPVTAQLRIAALTASVMKDDKDRLLAAGFDGYLEKPLDMRAFPEQVAALLQGRSQGLHE